MSQSQNKFIIGYGVVTAIGAGVLGYLCFSASTEHDEITNTLNSKQGQVTTLQTAPLYPNQENVDKKRAQVDAFSAQVDKLHTAMIAYQRALDTTITPDAVNAKFGKYKAQLEAMAQGRNIKLPAHFDMGLARYLAGTPRLSATPQVDYLGDSVNGLILNLFKNGITQLDAVNCPEQAYEKDDPPPPPPPSATKKPAPKPATAKKEKTPAAPKVELPALDEVKVFTRYKIQLTFTGSEKSVQDSLNQIGNMPSGGPFYVINSIRIENEKKDGPPKGTPFAATPITPPAGAPADAAASSAMIDARYILGNEKITAAVDIDLVRFLDPEVAKQEPAARK